MTFFTISFYRIIQNKIFFHYFSLFSMQIKHGYNKKSHNYIVLKNTCIFPMYITHVPKVALKGFINILSGKN